MAAPMRSSSQEAGHRARVADSRTTAKQDTQPSNFEYDDNEWDIGIGDLIIDLDADIEKTNEGSVGPGGCAMATNATAAASAKTASKISIEHSATVDKGLKMKIKRTKPGTKTSEAKHEIVKSNEQNGNATDPEIKGAQKHLSQPTPSIPQNANPNGNKRGSSGHRRDKTRDKHSATDKPLTNKPPPPATAVTVSEMNGIVRVSAPQPGLQRPVFPASTGPGPPPAVTPPGPPPSPAAATAQGSAAKPEQAKGNTAAPVIQPIQPLEERSMSPPPKKVKTEPKDVADVCVGTSVGTITEPDCLGPCEPGTSVTLEGIVWHETEGGVLVVNVTWRGKTYVGTLLDCTRHDWAPPRFCDSPTSDLDQRTPKGRETRSSVHSKLRNGGVKGRRGAPNGPGPSTAPSSPTPFVPPRTEPSSKRKVRTGEEETQQNAPVGKKAKVISTPPPVAVNVPPVPCGSPPPSPVLLECPEPNCSKKYKHINGLKYHQSHAHGSVDDDDTKDVTSMSENDESNMEAPSPVTPVKSPEKSQDSPVPKKENEIPLLLRGTTLLDVPSGGSSQPGTPRSTPPSPATPQSLHDMVPRAGSPTVPIVESKNVVKPGILRYGNTEEFPIGVFTGNKTLSTGSTNLPNNSNQLTSVRTVTVSVSPEPSVPPQETPIQPQTFTNQLQSQIPQQFTQPTALLMPAQNAQNSQIPLESSPGLPQSPTGQLAKITQFKVKPAAALMPEEKKDRSNKPAGFRKKNRNPDPPQAEQPLYGLEQTGREDVQSPAYSDISDDGAPVLEMVDKTKNPDKKTEQPLPHMSQYGIYPYYGQNPYIVPSVQQETKPKEPEKVVEKPPLEKEAKKDGEYPPKLMQHYMPFGYMSGYAYNLDYGSSVPMVAEEKIKEERNKEDTSPSNEHAVKPITPIPNPIQVPTPGKLKPSETGLKEKHQNENHQILKESIEIKSQMNSYMYSRQQQQQQQQHQMGQQQQREEDMRRFYVYDQRRKEQQQQQNVELHKSSQSNKNPPPQSPSLKHKEKMEEKEKKEIKQEGVKPTMETQGPPPPPTSQYAYIHPTYMQSPHYGPLTFDPSHPMYRGIMVPSPYSTNPYLHPQMPRYHAPEDLSRAQPPTKALDMLQHHAQYYSSHKIHELQERALKSPTPKTSMASSSPQANSGNNQAQVVSQMQGVPTSQANNNVTQSGGKQTPGDNKESRSPPPQRHVHTHHHTHVGLGYPMYPAPYGAAVLASQQAAAVTVINPYPPK